jgi:hypothetical protein
MRGVVLAALAFCFGAADQYLGSLWSLTHLGPWSVDLSLMSAPWLALPFLVGVRAPDPTRAALLGGAATFAALLGYFAMTLSPIEGVSVGQIHPVQFLASQAHLVIPAAVTGPAWGWLGYRWRVARSRLSAGLVAGAFCLEPVARVVYGQPFKAAGVAIAEVLAGLLLTVVMILSVRGQRASGRAT